MEFEYAMVYTLYSIQWYSVKYDESQGRPALSYLGPKQFKRCSIASASWSPRPLRSTGSDHRTSAASASASTSSSSSAATPSSASADVVSSIIGGLFASLLSRLVTISSLLTINPFSKLSADDFSSDTPPWSTGFFGMCNSYSFMSSSQQARMRVHENIKRFARIYAMLFIVFFACALYQMPLALVGLLASLALWELFKYCSDIWNFDRHPSVRKLLIGIGQCSQETCKFRSRISDNWDKKKDKKKDGKNGQKGKKKQKI